MIKYSDNVKNITESQLSGFFVGWPNPPDKNVFFRILRGSYKVILAMDAEKVVGSITAVSDGVMSAYIPLLEVLPEYQSKGIGGALISKMKKELSHLYMIDLICDEELISYYEKHGMKKSIGMSVRNYEHQNGSSL